MSKLGPCPSGSRQGNLVARRPFRRFP